MSKPVYEPEVRTAKIRQLNDLLRDTRITGRVMIMGALAERLRDNPEETEAIMQRIGQFNDWNDDNDPHNEHDFGSFEHDGERIMFKIDYYAPDLKSGSEDPADPTKTLRVMTVFFASDY